MTAFLRARDPDSIVYGVTAGVSAWSLLRGQLSHVRAQGFDVVLVSGGGDLHHEAVVREGVVGNVIPMTREVSLGQDIKSLMAWVYFLALRRPATTNLSTPKAALVGGIAAVITRVPRRIYVVRGLRFEGTFGIKRSVLLLMERLTLAAATDVISVSPSVAREIHRAKLTSKPITVVGDGSSNGVDPSRFAAISDSKRLEVRRALGFSDGTTVLGFIGRLTQDKGLDSLAEAMRLLAEPGKPPIDVALLLVGDGEDPTTVKHFRSLPLPVILTGFVQQPEDLLGAIDVLLLPTKREGFPNVVLEAALSEVPTITTRATGAIDSVVDGETGLLVPVGDARALAAAIEALVLDPSSRSMMGAAARARALDRFAPPRIWTGLVNIYRGRTSSDLQWIAAP